MCKRVVCDNLRVKELCVKGCTWKSYVWKFVCLCVKALCVCGSLCVQVRERDASDKVACKELCVQVCVKELCVCVLCMKALCVEVCVCSSFVCERGMFKRDVCSRLCVREVCMKEVCVEVCVFASMSPSATPATQKQG